MKMAQPTDTNPTGAVLYIVSTPIGNLEDITLRALRTLKEVDLIAAEDTRHTRRLLAHYEIDTPTTSYFEGNQIQKGERLVARLKAGESIALVSDAGTPTISDPGYRLLIQCIEAGIPIIPIPGPSACIAAASVAGLPLHNFVFEGFLSPLKSGKAETPTHRAAGGKANPHLLRIPTPDNLVPARCSGGVWGSAGFRCA